MAMDVLPVYPAAIRSGGIRSQLQCSVPGCLFSCRKIKFHKKHIDTRHTCYECAHYCVNLSQHVCRKDQIGQRAPVFPVINSDNFIEQQRASLGAVRSLFATTQQGLKDLDLMFAQYRLELVHLVSQLLQQLTNIKMTIKVTCLMSKEDFDVDGNAEEVEQVAYFANDFPKEILTLTDVDSAILECKDEIISKVSEYVERGSGFRVKQIQLVELKIAKYQRFSDARGHKYIPMPKPMRQGCCNLRVERDCLKYAVCVSLFWDEVKHKVQRRELYNAVTWAPYFNRLNWDGIENDIYDDVAQFEDLNECGVNILTHDGPEISFVRKAQGDYSRVANIFLIKGHNGEFHYAGIHNLNKFTTRSSCKKKFRCDYCFTEFTKQETMLKHRAKCNINKKTFHTEVQYPPPEARFKFYRPQMSLFAPFQLEYDFETYSVPIDKENDPSTGSTKYFCEYKPAAFTITITDTSQEKVKLVANEYYAGRDDLMEVFFKRLFYWSKRLVNKVRNTNNKKVPTPQELQKHIEAKYCSLCGVEFVDQKSVKKDERYKEQSKFNVYHHHHYEGTGSEIGSICSKCNLKIVPKRELVCIAHNATGFDMKLIVQALNSPQIEQNSISVLSKNSERFIQLEVESCRDTLDVMYNPHFDDGDSDDYYRGPEPVKLRFIDSCQFLHGPLADLVEAVRKEKSPLFSLVTDVMKDMLDHDDFTEEDIELLLKKQFYRYRYLTGPEVLKPGHPIPPREYFNNDLTGRNISDEDWAHVQKVIKRFNIRDFASYTKVYTTLDTALLSIVVENFRRKLRLHYKLDPLYVPTISSYSLQAFLFSSGVEIDYIRDEGMLDMIEKGIRGGMCFPTVKKATANNERCKDYDPNSPRTHLLYLDYNQLYATALKMKYPLGEFQWVSPKDFNEKDWSKDKSPDDHDYYKGYILECDLIYPHELHDQTTCYPLLPGKRKVEFSELSESQQFRAHELGNVRRTFMTQPRLVTDCMDKRRYVLHYELLRWLLQFGIKIEKIHRCLEFREEAYAKDYIELGTKLRQQATSPSESATIKLVMNSLFGKFLQRDRDHMDVKFCSDYGQILEYTANPRFRDVTIIDSRVTIVFLSPEKQQRNKIVQSGMTCLDYSNVLMFDGFYNDLMPGFGGRAYTLYTDTDSHILFVRDDDDRYCEDLYGLKDKLDFSKLNPNSPLIQKYLDLKDKGKGQGRLWKIESLDIKEGIFLKPKSYSLKMMDDKYELKNKGVPYASMKQFDHNSFNSVLENKEVVKVNFKSIISKGHKLYQVDTEKISMHDFDVTRHYGGVDFDGNPDPNFNYSYPYYHHRLSGCTCQDDEEVVAKKRKMY